jgi:hypothetical protein
MLLSYFTSPCIQQVKNQLTMKMLAIIKDGMCILFVFYDKLPYKSFTLYPCPFPEFHAKERKVKLSSYEDIWGIGYIAPSFLTSLPDGSECSASLPGRFTLRKEPQYPMDKWLDGPQRVWTMWRKISYPCRERNPGRPAHSPSLYWLSYGHVVLCSFIFIFSFKSARL